jgi:hypothetical protein
MPRFARGTAVPSNDGDVTVVTAAPAPGEETSPYITVPTEVKPTGYAHTRRVAAKHR